MMSDGKATAAKTLPTRLTGKTLEPMPFGFTGRGCTPGAYPKAEADPGCTR